MVSVTNVSAGQAGTYYQKDSYYAKEQGEWQGKGAEALGLNGEIKKEDFLNLIEGKNPHGDELVQANSQGEHRAGIDLAFSTPKSASIMGLITGDERIREAHKAAVEKTLKMVEEKYAQGRVTQDGETRRVGTGNLVIAKFQHDVSRELDPQLHDHCVVMNMTQREDGEWRALSNEKLFENKILIGQIYRNELAVSLKELGYSIQSDEKGLFEIRGIDEKLIDAFSQRSEQINEKVKELKESGLYPNAGESRLREIATLGSRVAKEDVNMEVVKETWQERLKEQGYSKESILESIQKATEQVKEAELERKEPKLNEYDYISLAGKIITEQESTFTKEEILKVSGRLSIGEQRIENLEKAFYELNKDKEIVTLKHEIYTTKEIKGIEKNIVEKVKAGHDKLEAVMSKEQIKKIITEKYNHLTHDQKDAATHILTSKDRYMGVHGDAGTGKTTMLTIVRQELEAQGYDVKGFAFTGKAAEELEKGAGIKSQTLHSFLNSENQIKNEKQTWILDESSMVGSKQFLEFIKKAEQENARVVLVGDTKQLQSIQAGPIFKKLQETKAIRIVEMKEIVRQTDGEYKDIVKNVTEKKINEAFKSLEKYNRIHEINNRDERLNAIVKEYDYKYSLVVTSSNVEKNELNNKIRDEMKTQGRLQGEEFNFTVRESKGLNPAEQHFAQSYQGGDIVFINKAGVGGLKAGAEAKVTMVDENNHKITIETAKGTSREIDLKKYGQHLTAYQEKNTSFCNGEKIVFLKNDKEIKVKNGEVGVIKDIDEHGNIKIKTGDKEVSLNIKFYPYIDRGYCVTDYKSQGQTSKEVIFNSDTSRDTSYNSFYVAVSRGRENVQVFTDSKENLKEQVKKEQIKTSTLDYEKIEKVIDEKNKDTDISKEQGEPVKLEKDYSKAKEMEIEM